jgi:hypothetical protein
LILNDIREKLLEVDSNVFYGMVDSNIRETVWDYIVFERERMTVSSNKTSHSYYFAVRIIRENFIPDGFEKTVIDKMCEIEGMKLADNDPTFDYVPKPNTNVVIEMLTLHFVKPVKV